MGIRNTRPDIRLSSSKILIRDIANTEGVEEWLEIRSKCLLRRPTSLK